MSESGKIPKSEEPESRFDPDGVIKKFENDSSVQAGSQKVLLDNFLSQISVAVSLQSKAGINEFEDIQSVELSEYCVFRRLIRNVSSLK